MTAAALAPLFDYPGPAVLATALRVRAEIGRVDPDAAAELDPFVEWLANTPSGTVEETYTRTFYLSPSCTPYVGVHIFGEESFQRGGLMARLDEAFVARGFDRGAELPDHVGVLLRFAATCDDDELADLVTFCLSGPVERMAGQIGRTRNPYRHVLAALHLALGARLGTRASSPPWVAGHPARPECVGAQGD